MTNIQNDRDALIATDPGPHADKKAAIYLGGVGQQLNAKIVDLIDGMTKSVDTLSINMAKDVGRVIESNEKLAKSNDKHSRAMFWLTAALVVFAAAQVWVSWAK